MIFELAVDRSLKEYASNSALTVSMDPSVMEKQGLQAGDLIRIATFWRELWARVGPGEEADRGTGLLRLDRLQRQTLKVHIHEKVEISREDAKAVSKVRLQPAVDLSAASSHHIEEHLKEEMVANKTPVTSGAILFMHFHHSVAGTLYKVVDVQGGPGVVTEDTDVILDTAPDGFSNELGLDITFEDLGGLDQEIRLIKELIQLPLQFPSIYRQVGIQPPRGVIFYGPPGTGKTRLARAMANEVNAQFYYINGPDVIGTTYGESEGNLRKMFGEATHHAPSIIFIDEIDVLAPKRGETGSHTDTRLVTQLLSLMDGMNKVDGVVIVATTNRLNSIDAALRRPGRFDRELYIGPPNEEGRLQILQVHTREMPLSEDAKAYLPELAASTHGFVGADLMELCREAGLHGLRRSISDLTSGQSLAKIEPEKIKIERQDFKAARGQCRPSASREPLVLVSNQGFETIGGLLKIKKELVELVVEPLRAPSDSEESSFRDGILLSGPSGSGKSLLVKALAKEAGVNLISISGPELFSKWLGESEEAVRHVFQLARQLNPCIVFFDQLDAMAPERGKHLGSQTTERVVNQLLAELDSLDNSARIIPIAATNRLDLIDSAVLRPGRFGKKIELPLPKREERKEILNIHLSSLRIREKLALDLIDELAVRTEGMSGAELRSLSEEIRRQVQKQGASAASPFTLNLLPELLRC